MNSEDVLNTIEAISEEPGRNKKQVLLAELLKSDLGRWVVMMTYDPFKIYGIKCPIPSEVEGGRSSIDFRRPLIEPLLDDLIARKLTGNAAHRELFLTMQSLNRTGKEIMWRIISKDLRCGIGRNTIKAIDPNLIPSFSVMRAGVYKEGMIQQWPQKGEFKLDGQRNTFLCKDGAGAFFTRSGKHVPALDFFVPSLINVGRFAAHTDLREVIVDENGGLSFMLDGEAMMGLFEDTGVFRRKNQDAKGSELHLYDIMSYSDFNLTAAAGDALSVRRENLSKFVRFAKQVLSGTENSEMIQMVPQYFLNSHEDVEKLFALARSKTLAQYLARGDKEREKELLKTTIDRATGKPKVLEGIMVKNPNARYSKTRSNAWLKLKAEETKDLVLIGAYPGESGTKYENCLGGIILDHQGCRVRCGGGFSDSERIRMWKDWNNDIQNIPNEFILNEKGAAYVDPQSVCANDDLQILGRIVEVEFNEVTPDGSLRHPRFVRFRDDKAGELDC